jgi:CBS domain-containing protein
MATLHAKEVMTKKPEFLPPTATLKQAAEQMRSHDYGFIPVGENDRLIGAVTDRDLATRGTAQGKDPNKTTLRDIMSKGIQYCFEEDDLNTVAKQMEQGRIRRLVVLNKSKRMTGIISLGDIVTKSKDKKITWELTDAVSEH